MNLVTEKSGVLNLGLEGMILVEAVFGFILNCKPSKFGINPLQTQYIVSPKVHEMPKQYLTLAVPTLLILRQFLNLNIWAFWKNLKIFQLTIHNI